MKSIFILLTFLSIPCLLFSQWTLDRGHSKFSFIASHHGISKVDGYFKKFEDNITATAVDLSDAVFEVSIESASITTDLDPRDNHLKSEDIFDVIKHAAITFKSTSFKKIRANIYSLAGDLTMKGITKSVSFDVEMNGPVPNPNQNAKNMQVGMKAPGNVCCRSSRIAHHRRV